MSRKTNLAYKAFLSQDSFYSVPKAFITCFGFECAGLLSYIIQRYYYHHNEGKLSYSKKLQREVFYLTIEKIESDLGILRKTQEKHIATLIKNKLIYKVLHGTPAKRHFAVDLEMLTELMFQWSEKQIKSQASLDEQDKLERTNDTNLDCTNGTTSKYKELEYKQENINDDYNEAEKEAQSESQNTALGNKTQNPSTNVGISDEIVLNSISEIMKLAPKELPSLIELRKKELEGQNAQKQSISDEIVLALEETYGVVDASRLLEMKKPKDWYIEKLNRKKTRPYSAHFTRIKNMDSVTLENLARNQKIRPESYIKLMGEFWEQIKKDNKQDVFKTENEFFKHFSNWRGKRVAAK